MVLGISSTVIYVVKTSSQSTNSIKAALIAREGLEVYRDLVRDDITDLTNGNYGLTNSSGKWAVGGISDNASGFVRQIIVADDPINTSSPILSKKITSTVTYNNGTETYSLSTLLTNWRRYKAPPAQYWAFPSVNGSLDITLGTYTMTKFVKVGNYIYGIRAVANTNNLIVMDVTNPAAPAYVTQFSVNGTPSGIAYSGNYLYISTSDNTREITVVDITTRTSPTYYAYYDATGNTDTTGLSIVGNRLYLTRGGNAADPEFMILNITNPAAIVSVGVFQE